MTPKEFLEDLAKRVEKTNSTLGVKLNLLPRRVQESGAARAVIMRLITV